MTLKEFATLGGHARAKALSKEERVAIARKAGIASGNKRKLASKQEQCQSPNSPPNKK